MQNFLPPVDINKRIEVATRIKYLNQVETKRQYSSINPNSILGYIGPQEQEVRVALESDQVQPGTLGMLQNKSPIKASSTLGPSGLRGLSRQHQAHQDSTPLLSNHDSLSSAVVMAHESPRATDNKSQTEPKKDEESALN